MSPSPPADGIGRHEIHDVADRPEQHPLRQGVAIDPAAAPLGPRIRFAAALILGEFDSNDHSALAHFRNVRVVRKVACATAEIRRGGPILLDDVVRGEDVQRRECGRAGEGIAGVAVRMQEGGQLGVVVVERRVHVVGRDDHRQRQVTAGQALGQAHEIRRDAGLLAGEHRPGSAESDRYLVGDQMDAVTIARFAQA